MPSALQQRMSVSNPSEPTSVLVIGGAGGVGTGIVLGLLAYGSFARVIVSSRNVEKLAALRTLASDDPRLVTIVGSVEDSHAAEALLTRVRELGTLGAVVASLGGWWSGASIVEIDQRTWSDGLANLLTPHFIAARTFVPALETENARYLLVGGGAAFVPVPGSTLVSIAGAAQAMLARSIVAERRNRTFPIVEELVIDGPVATNAEHHGARRTNEIAAREVGDVVAQMLHTGTTGAWPNVIRDGPIVTIAAKSPTSYGQPRLP